MRTQVSEQARERARTIMAEANRLTLEEHLEPHEVAERLGMSYANLRMNASKAGMRYRRQPGLWVPRGAESATP